MECMDLDRVWWERNVRVELFAKVVGLYGVLEGLCSRFGFAGEKQEVFEAMGICGLIERVV